MNFRVTDNSTVGPMLATAGLLVGKAYWFICNYFNYTTELNFYYVFLKIFLCMRCSIKY